jgi:hypothetical protein
MELGNIYCQVPFRCQLYDCLNSQGVEAHVKPAHDYYQEATQSLPNDSFEVLNQVQGPRIRQRHPACPRKHRCITKLLEYFVLKTMNLCFGETVPF